MACLKDKTVLILGRGSGIAGAVALAVSEDGGTVIAAGRHPDDLADTYRGLDIGIERVDVKDESSVAALAGRKLAAGGSFLFMSGATALKPASGMLAVAATNAAVDAITAGLAVELAPIRVNAIAPATIDTRAYDALGDERKTALFNARSATNPARRIGTADDIAAVALSALANGFLTGVSIPVDGGEHLV